MNTQSDDTNSQPATESRSGAKCLIEGLEHIGCEVMFGYPGGPAIDLFDELVKSKKIHHILPRHEQGAAHMADGYARATGKCGFCMVTSGPGATNTVTGLATANMDGIPMICITAQVATSMIGNDAFQEADTCGITRSITKHNYLVRNVDDLPRIIVEAHHIATTGKPGPVLIDIPKDVQKSRTSVPFPAKPELRGYRPRYEGHPKMIKKLADAINESKKPLLYAGGGVIASGTAELLTELARKFKLPVTTTLLGLGAFPETDPLSLRMVGMHGSVVANRALAECDLLVSIGARFDDRVTGKISEFAPNAKIAHIDIDPAAIGKSIRTDIPVVGHLKPVLEDLIPQLIEQDHSEWLDKLATWKRDWPFSYSSTPGVISAQYVVEQVYEISKGQAIVCTDVGQNQMFAAQFFKHTQSRNFLSSGGLGTMGYGLPAAIGAQLGRPGEQVVVIAGDGGIQMNFQELVVAVEHDLPIKVVIVNNGYLGMVRQWQDMFYKHNYSAIVMTQHGRLPNEQIKEKPDAPAYLPDFVMLAHAHGAEACRVSKPEDVAPALAKAFADSKVWVLEFIVEPEGSVLPMIPPGATVRDIITK